MLQEYAPQGTALTTGAEAFSSSNMAPFLTKLYQIVSAQTTDHCIQWTPKGDSFVISDPDTFARDILPTYFKHNNIRSFIRQLNTYGFRKRTNISSTDEHLEFFHAKFRRDDPGQLTQIKRCHQPKPQAAAARSVQQGLSHVAFGGAEGDALEALAIVARGKSDVGAGFGLSVNRPEAHPLLYLPKVGMGGPLLARSTHVGRPLLSIRIAKRTSSDLRSATSTCIRQRRG